MSDERPGEPTEPTDDGETVDLEALLGAYALDAVDDLERFQVERLLAADTPAGRAAAAEVARYEDAVAALVELETAIEPPAQAWESIRAHVAASPRRSALEARRRRAAITRVVLGIAAAVLIAVGVGVAVNRGSRSPGPADQFASAVTAPGAHHGTFQAALGSAVVVVTPTGTGWIDMRGMPAPAAGHVYQLWSLDSGVPVSLGVVQMHGGVATFSAPASSTKVAISVETAPGATTPTLPPVAVATLS